MKSIEICYMNYLSEAISRPKGVLPITECTGMKWFKAPMLCIGLLSPGFTLVFHAND